MAYKPLALLTLVGAATVLAGCAGLPDGSVTVTNDTGQLIRVTGSCTPDGATTLMPGESSSDVYPGAQCRIDNGDGLDGMLACITLSNKHTVIRAAGLKDPPGPDECWGAGRQ